MANELKSITFRTDAKKVTALDSIAAFLGQDRTTLLNQALDYLLEVQKRQHREIRKGMKQIANGEVIKEEAMDAFFAKRTR